MLLVILMIKIIFLINCSYLIKFGGLIKLFRKPQLHKIGQSGRFSGKLLGPLLKTGLPFIGNVLKPLVKSVLIP